MRIPPKRPGVVEEQIEAAMKRGDFNNLKGKGRPLNLRGDLADPKTMGQKLRGDAGFSVPWEDVGAEIDGLATRLAQTLRRAARLGEGEEKRKVLSEAETLLRAANSRILHYNLIIPSQLPHLYRARLKLEDF